jgi:hypothetical protein
MKLQTTSQGIKVTSDFSFKPYVLLGFTGLLGLPIIKFVIDLITLLAKVQVVHDDYAYGLVGLVLLLLLPSTVKTLIMIWQKLSKFQLEFCEIDTTRQQIAYKLSNFLFQRKVLNLSISQIRNIQVLYCGQSSSLGEERYGLRINLNQEAGQGFYLDRGTLLLQQAQEFAQVLQSFLDKPVLLEPQIDSDWFDQSFFATTLERTEDRLSLRFNYAIMSLLICLLFVVFGFSISSFIALSFSDVETKNSLTWLYQLLRWGTPISMIWMMQTLGFQETWCFDRQMKQFRYEQQLLIGRKAYDSANSPIHKVEVIGSSASKHGWRVTIDAPKLERIVRRQIVFYSNRDLKLVRAFAEDLRYYLNQS